MSLTELCLSEHPSLLPLSLINPMNYPVCPPLSSINAPLLFLPTPPPSLSSPSWTSDQLRPCPALTARQHFLSPLASPRSSSFFSSFWVSCQPLSTQRDREQTKGGRKKERILYFQAEKCSVQMWVSVCAGWRASFCKTLSHPHPQQEVYFPPARRLDFKDEERHRDTCTAVSTQWEDVFSH